MCCSGTYTVDSVTGVTVGFGELGRSFLERQWVCGGGLGGQFEGYSGVCIVDLCHQSEQLSDFGFGEACAILAVCRRW